MGFPEPKFPLLYLKFIFQTCSLFLVMEQADAGEGHRHVVFVAGLDHVVIANGSARLRDIFHAALMCTLDIVTEREERVRAQCHVGHLIQPCTLLLLSEYRRFYLKGLLPYAVSQHIHVLVTDVNVNGVIAVCTA